MKENCFHQCFHDMIALLLADIRLIDTVSALEPNRDAYEHF